VVRADEPAGDLTWLSVGDWIALNTLVDHLWDKAPDAGERSAMSLIDDRLANTARGGVGVASVRDTDIGRAC
jgi:hypothetical protein